GFVGPRRRPRSLLFPSATLCRSVSLVHSLSSLPVVGWGGGGWAARAGAAVPGRVAAVVRWVAEITGLDRVHERVDRARVEFGEAAHQHGGGGPLVDQLLHEFAVRGVQQGVVAVAELPLGVGGGAGAVLGGAGC